MKHFKKQRNSSKKLKVSANSLGFCRKQVQKEKPDLLKPPSYSFRNSETSASPTSPSFADKFPSPASLTSAAAFQSYVSAVAAAAGAAGMLTPPTPAAAASPSAAAGINGRSQTTPGLGTNSIFHCFLSVKNH